MITENDLYWMTRLDALKHTLDGLVFAFGTLCFLGFFASVIFWGEDKKFGVRSAVCTLVFFFLAIVLGIGNAFLPTTREMAAIKIIPRIANNEDVQALGSEIPKLAKEWLEELRPKKTPAKAEAEAKAKP